MGGRRGGGREEGRRGGGGGGEVGRRGGGYSTNHGAVLCSGVSLCYSIDSRKFVASRSWSQTCFQESRSPVLGSRAVGKSVNCSGRGSRRRHL